MTGRPTRRRFRISRYTITSSEDGETPRTLRELNALWALGAILNKRDWYIKWTMQPHVRAKWLAEIEDALVKASVAHVWSLWPNRRHLRKGFERQDEQRFGDDSDETEGVRVNAGFDGMGRLLDAASLTNAQAKSDTIQQIVADVMYPPGHYAHDAFDEGYAYGTDVDDAPADSRYHDYDDDKDYEASAIVSNFAQVFRDHKTRNPFGQIAWYVAMSMVRDELRGIEPKAWTVKRITKCATRIWSSENQTVISRTCELIQNVLRGDGPPAIQLISLLPEETRANVVELLHLHLTNIDTQVESVKQDISNVLDMVIKNLGLHDAVVAYSPGQAPKTWLSDNCIPAKLKTKFVAEIASLENVPDDKKDWHPNSNGQVLDLVHPSLYCGLLCSYLINEDGSVEGQEAETTFEYTRMLAASEADNLYASPAAHMRAIMFAPTPRPLLQESNGHSFQWLPCEIDVAEVDGTARIRTYINNLHPEDHAGLYDSIGAIFTQFVPLFDQVLSSLDDALVNTVLTKTRLAKEIEGEPCASLCLLTPPTLFEYDTPRFTLKGKRCR